MGRSHAARARVKVIVKTREKLFKFVATHGAPAAARYVCAAGKQLKVMKLVRKVMKSSCVTGAPAPKLTVFKRWRTERQVCVLGELLVHATERCVADVNNVDTDMNAAEHATVIVSDAMQRAADTETDLNVHVAAVRNTGRGTGAQQWQKLALWANKHGVDAKEMETMRTTYVDSVHATCVAARERVRTSTDPTFVTAAPVDTMWTGMRFPAVPYVGWRVLHGAEQREAESTSIRVTHDDVATVRGTCVFVGLADPLSTAPPSTWVRSVAYRQWTPVRHDDTFLVSTVCTVLDAVDHMLSHGVDMVGHVGPQCVLVRDGDCGGEVVFERRPTHDDKPLPTYAALADLIMHMCVQTYVPGGTTVNWRKAPDWRSSATAFCAANFVALHAMPAALCVAVGALTHPDASKYVQLPALVYALRRVGRPVSWWSSEMGAAWPPSMCGRSAIMRQAETGHYMPIAMPEDQLAAHAVWGAALRAGHMVFKDGWAWPTGGIVDMKRLGETYAASQPYVDGRFYTPQPLCPVVHARAVSSMLSSHVGCDFLEGSKPNFGKCMEAITTWHCVSGAYQTLWAAVPAAMGAPAPMDSMQEGAWAFFTAALKVVAQ